ncbi:DUF1289 domain-containing protein [Sphingomonas gei]|uniref:DUF1289 domain-containing protein n=1 Tax=Sphingomonas gei TaxID=1395960 RepID=A0A4S1X9A5_9SPHN|nr:DUF1289 domain-containing protein [Sphingomonas gei]TGX52824.1 DUF1289 domain-containing protein [Sphingomonas gei]
MTAAPGAGSTPIPSPCTNICRIDVASGWCIGCGRTLDEIVRWGSTDDADRAMVMAQLPERRKKL